jgi:hypothetical protein
METEDIMIDIEIMPEILVSKLICPDGTVLHSKYRHDFQEHTDTVTGQWMMLDGGNSYIKHSGTGELFTVTTEDPHELIREHFIWGSRGKLGDEPLVYLILKNIEDDHLSAILRTQTQLSSHIVKVFENEAEYRTYNVI